MHRVFLDANVLFSAAYDPRSRITQLWRAGDLELFVSPFVSAEALRNLQAKRPRQLKTLRQLLNGCRLVDEAPHHTIPAGVDLSEKDRPVLSAAIACKADYLLTGDTHFRTWFGRVIAGTTIMRPGDYLAMHSR
jgi:predicted nucleic acid-binding protein